MIHSLHSFMIKESYIWDFLRNPLGTICSGGKILGLLLYLLAIFGAVGGWSYYASAIFPYSFNMLVYVCGLFFMALVPVVYMQFSKYRQEMEGFKEKMNFYTLTLMHWMFFYAAVIGWGMFVLFGSNSFRCGGEIMQTKTVVQSAGEFWAKSNAVVAVLPDSNIYFARVGKDKSYKEGMEVTVYYRKGRWGILFGENIEHRQ